MRSVLPPPKSLPGFDPVRTSPHGRFAPAGQRDRPHHGIVNPAEFGGAVETTLVREPHGCLLHRRIEQRRCRAQIEEDGIVGIGGFSCGGDEVSTNRVMSSIRPLRRHDPSIDIGFGGAVLAVNGAPADVAAVRAIVGGVGIRILRRLIVKRHPRVSHVIPPIRFAVNAPFVGKSGNGGASGRDCRIFKRDGIAVHRAARLIDDPAIPLQAVAGPGFAKQIAVQ